MDFGKQLQEFCHALPVRIGGPAYMVRNYRGTKAVKAGLVSELYFTSDMRLMAVVKHVGRGEVNKTVFASSEEAEKLLKGKGN